MHDITIHGKNSFYSFNPANRIGEGGMGRVFAGIDGRTRQKVAIKVLFNELTQNAMAVEKFQQEGELRLNHPNVIQMLDFALANGKYHVISRFINGGDIVTYCRQMADWREKVRLFAQVLDGLHYLHSQRPPIIHRDIKPSNIMIENGRPILMDLGVAKVTGGKRQTSVGVLIGTPQYSPPEQIRGENQAINATTDIYAAAITLYEVLTGRAPFDGTNEFSILEMQIKNTIPPHTQVPMALYAVLKKATAKSQAARYQSMTEFKAALLQSLDEGSWLDRIRSLIQHF